MPKHQDNIVNLRTNMRMRFVLPFKGTVLHKNDSKSQITLPEACEFRADILSENTTAETLDLEVVGNGNILGDGDRISDVPFSVLAIHGDDVRRVVREMAGVRMADPPISAECNGSCCRKGLPVRRLPTDR